MLDITSSLLPDRTNIERNLIQILLTLQSSVKHAIYATIRIIWHYSFQ